jgi:formamidopyrimidine-DNA glycosylase
MAHCQRIYGCSCALTDEILYHARVHPERRSNALTDEQLIALHYQTSNVCEIAVSVDADDSKFPENWLFKHRWVCTREA